MSYIFPHIEVLQEENLSPSNLPVELRDMIQEFNELQADYDQAPSEEGLEELKRESVTIADEIQDYLEETLEESEEEEEEPKTNYSTQTTNTNGSGKAKWRFW
jgi:predicted RNase H-like nuclease (RuvC/YqgF family)